MYTKLSLGATWSFPTQCGIAADIYRYLEIKQRASVKVILGKNYQNYEEALSELKIDSLNKRRTAWKSWRHPLLQLQERTHVGSTDLVCSFRETKRCISEN